MYVYDRKLRPCLDLLHVVERGDLAAHGLQARHAVGHHLHQAIGLAGNRIEHHHLGDLAQTTHQTREVLAVFHLHGEIHVGVGAVVAFFHADVVDIRAGGGDAGSDLGQHARLVGRS